MTNSAVCWKTRASWWYSSVFGIDTGQAVKIPERGGQSAGKSSVPAGSQPWNMTPQRLHADASVPSLDLRAYLLGALHDGTRSDRHRTHRFAQKGTEWLARLSTILSLL